MFCTTPPGRSHALSGRTEGEREESLLFDLLCIRTPDSLQNWHRCFGDALASSGLSFPYKGIISQW